MGTRRTYAYMRRQALWSLGLLMACQGTIGDPNGELVDDPNRPEVCVGEVGPTIAPLGRLTAREYEASLRAILGDAPVDAIRSTLDSIPLNESDEEGAFGRQDGRLLDRHVDGYFRAADAVGAAVAADGALRMAAGGACESAVDDACVRAFAETLARKAWRRPPDNSEINDLVARVDELSGNEKIHGVVFAVLMSPDFLYRFENRGDERRGVVELTPYELASRLSFHFWAAPPDAELLAAAESGDLDDPDLYEAQVQRLFEDPRTEHTLMHFFEEWLHLERGDFAESPRLDVLRGEMSVDGLAAEMRAEVDELIAYYLDNGGTWDDVVTSNLSFARTQRLADIYGVEVWDGTGTPPTLPPERSGLLTRAGMLFSADGSTNPFRRGVFVRRAMLCDEVLPPPSSLPPDALTPPPVEEGATTRQAFEAKVVDEPCATCHAQFSEFGYALEAFDGLGRHRTEEHLVTTDGTDRGFAPVDPSVVPRVDYDDTRPVGTAVELNQRIAESIKASECLSRQYFRFTYRHFEQGSDYCTIDAWAHSLEEGQSLRETLRSVALADSFRQRLLEEED